jgi:peptide/nickel transport system substrate-binding protein
MMGLTPQQYLRQTTGPSWDRDYRKYQYLSFGYTFLGYNLQNPLFSDVRVRRALAHAIDKQEIVKGVLLGLGRPTLGPSKPGPWISNDSIKDTPTTRPRQILFAEADGRGPVGILRKTANPSPAHPDHPGQRSARQDRNIIQQRLKDVASWGHRTWNGRVHQGVREIGNFEAIYGLDNPQDPDGFDVCILTGRAGG